MGISAGIAAVVAARVLVTVTRSMIAGNGADGIAVSTQGAGTASAAISGCAIDVSTLRGVAAMGNGVAVAVCGNQITRNGGVGLAGRRATLQRATTLDSNGGGARTSGALTALAENLGAAGVRHRRNIHKHIAQAACNSRHRSAFL
jgi:hypothetical protein